MKCINTVWMTHIKFVYNTDGMWQYINSPRLWARNKRILLLKMLNIWENIQVNFTKRTANWIPCLSWIHLRALLNIVISTSAQVLTIHLTYTSLIIRHVSIFRSFSGRRTSKKLMKNTWIFKLLTKFIDSSVFCYLLCETPRRWWEDFRDISQY